MPKRQKIKKAGLVQYGIESFGTHFCHNQKKCGTERVNGCYTGTERPPWLLFIVPIAMSSAASGYVLIRGSLKS